MFNKVLKAVVRYFTLQKFIKPSYFSHDKFVDWASQQTEDQVMDFVSMLLTKHQKHKDIEILTSTADHNLIGGARVLCVDTEPPGGVLQRVTGVMDPLPKVGTQFILKIQNQQLGRFLLVNVNYNIIGNRKEFTGFITFLGEVEPEYEVIDKNAMKPPELPKPKKSTIILPGLGEVDKFGSQLFKNPTQMRKRRR